MSHGSGTRAVTPVGLAGEAIPTICGSSLRLAAA